MRADSSPDLVSASYATARFFNITIIIIIITTIIIIIINIIIIIIILGEAESDYSTSKPHPSSHPAPVNALTTVGQTDVGLAISRRGHPHVLFVHTGGHAQVLLPSSSHSTVDGQALVMGPCF